MASLVAELASLVAELASLVAELAIFVADQTILVAEFPAKSHVLLANLNQFGLQLGRDRKQLSLPPVSRPAVEQTHLQIEFADRVVPRVVGVYADILAFSPTELVQRQLLSVRVEHQIVGHLQLDLVLVVTLLVVLSPVGLRHILEDDEGPGGLNRDGEVRTHLGALLGDDDHVVRHDPAQLVLLVAPLDQQLAVDMHVRTLGRDEVETGDGDLALGGLGDGFHEVLRMLLPNEVQILLGGVGEIHRCHLKR